jgi:hypothetical protein
VDRRSTPPPSTSYTAAIIAGTFAYLMIGALPFQGGIVARAIVAGAVIGLGIRKPGDRAVLGVGAASIGLLGGIIVASWGQTATGYSATALELVLGPLLAPAIALGCGELRMRTSAVWAFALAVALLGGVFLHTVGVLPGPRADATKSLRTSLAVEPMAEQYGFDSYIFIRTSMQVDRGVPYYDAFISSYDGDSRLQGAPPGLLNIRQPWIYYAWKVLPGRSGTKIWDWFVVLALVSAGGVFWGMRKIVADPAALAASAGVLGYMAYPVVTFWFPLAEFWAGCVAVCAVMAMLRRKPYLAATLVTVAFAFRELAAWLIPVFAVWWLFSGERKRWWPALVIAVAGPVALFAAHTALSPVKQQAAGSVSFWMNSSLDTLLASLRFSGDLVPGGVWLYPVIALVALSGAFFLRDKTLRWPVVAAVAAPLALLGLFSSGQWGDYWGAIGMPAVLALSVAALGLLQQPDAPAIMPAPTVAKKHS